MALLAVRDLEVVFGGPGAQTVRAVDGLSLDVEPGEAVGIIGESGAGKTVCALAVLGLLRSRNAWVRGSVRLDGRELLGLSEKEMCRIRGQKIAMVFQDPSTSLNPVLTVGRQISEVLRHHFGLARGTATKESVALLDAVGIPAARRRARDYPHQFSGGMRQRVMIAMAVASRPALLVADEPTTDLDVTIQAQILELLRSTVAERGMGLVLLTHDLGVVAGTCQTVHVMYSGRIVESGPAARLFARPRHPYTAGLLASIPRLDRPRGIPLPAIGGSPRDRIPWTSACAFAPRCPNRVERCTLELPSLEADDQTRLLRCFNPVVP